MSRWFAIARDMKGGELNKTNSLFPEPESLMPASTPLRAPAQNKLFDSFNSPDPLNVQAPDPDAC